MKHCLGCFDAGWIIINGDYLARAKPRCCGRVEAGATPDIEEGLPINIPDQSGEVGHGPENVIFLEPLR